MGVSAVIGLDVLRRETFSRLVDSGRSPGGRRGANNLMLPLVIPQGSVGRERSIIPLALEVRLVIRRRHSRLTDKLVDILLTGRRNGA